MSDKHKMEVPTPTPKSPEGKVVTEKELQETVDNLKKQLKESEAKTLMIMGAIQVSELMLNPEKAKEAQVKNGQKTN